MYQADMSDIYIYKYMVHREVYIYKYYSKGRPDNMHALKLIDLTGFGHSIFIHNIVIVG